MSSNPDRVVLWAIASTAFFGFFRLGELLPESVGSFNPAVSLSWGDVAIDNCAAPQMVQIHLKQSKCDQAGVGADIVMGITGTALCPVTAILHYIEARGTQAGPFFVSSSQRPVVKPWFIKQIRLILAGIGLPHHQYASHSFRSGAATTAALVGLEDSAIQTLGRWHSSAFLQYIQTPKDHLAAMSVTLVGSPPPPTGVTLP